MTRPSLADFGTHDESAYPELWRGVVGAWCPSLGPTGNRLHDFSRRNNWGTLTNMDPATDWVVDRGQYALDFDGVNNNVQVGYRPEYDLSTVKSVSGWIFSRAYDGPFGINDCITTDFIANSRTWQFNAINQGNQQTAGLIVFSGGTGGGFFEAVTGQLLGVNIWHHIAFTTPNRFEVFDDVKVYIDGVGRSTVNNTSGTFITARTLQPQNTLGIGIRPGPNNQDLYFNGFIDDVQLHNRVLSPGEIQQLYRLGRGGIYERRRRNYYYMPPVQFLASWARNSNVILGAGATC